MKFRKNRKGFTIVELIIVIAVIAVLTAILVPTFIHLANKAGDAADKTIVKNANTQLAMRAAEGRKNTSMSEAVKDVDLIGYHMSGVQTSNGNQICWDRENDRFALFNKDNELIFSDGDVSFDKDNANDFKRFFKAVNSLSAEETHGFLPYAKELFSDDAVTVSGDAITLGTSLDIGDLANIKTINVDNDSATEIYLGTNSTNVIVNVDVPNGTVYHLGVAKDVIINDIAGTSMHEAGRVGFEKMNCAGRIVAEKTAEIKALWFAVANAKYEKVTGASVTEYAAEGVASTLTLTGITASDIITGATEGTVQAGAEQAIAAEIAKETGESSSSLEGNPISNFAELQAAFNDGGEFYLTANFDITSALLTTENVTIDLNGHTLTLQTTNKNKYETLIAVEGSGKTLLFKDSAGSGSVVNGQQSNSDAVFGFFLGGTLQIDGGTYLSTSDCLFGGFAMGATSYFRINGGSIYGYASVVFGSVIYLNQQMTLVYQNSYGQSFESMGASVATENELLKIEKSSSGIYDYYNAVLK